MVWYRRQEISSPCKQHQVLVRIKTMKKNANPEIKTKGTMTKTVVVKRGTSWYVVGMTIPRPINDRKFC